MQPTPLTVIDLQALAHGVDSYQNVLLAGANNHVARLGILTEVYDWHCHPNSDEIFLAVEGILCIDLAERTVELTPGQLFTIPANVRHRTRPQRSRSVNLTFELAAMETVWG